MQSGDFDNVCCPQDTTVLLASPNGSAARTAKAGNDLRVPHAVPRGKTRDLPTPSQITSAT